MECPLCHSQAVDEWEKVHQRDYFLCRVCRLVFVSPRFHLSPTQERARYEEHLNHPYDRRYRSFLDKLALPLMPYLKVGMSGLDYGSGPGPTLSLMLEERGFAMRNYDPFFTPEKSVLSLEYDFITCSEAAEHFYNPRQDFLCFERMLRPQGWLGIMTQFYDGRTRLSSWRYTIDPTHVCFYQVETMRWIGDFFGWRLEMPHLHIALFQKT
jgi:hypothetical protein